MLTRHTQNPAIGHYSAIFRHIQNLVQCLHMQKPDILGILKYPKLLHNCDLIHIQNHVIFKSWHKLRTLSKIQNGVFVKIVKNYNYFSKVLHFRSLTGVLNRSISQ